MLTNLSVDEALIQARFHAEKGEFAEAQKLYQAVSQTFHKQAKDLQQGLTSLNKPKPNDSQQKLSQEVVNQLVGLYNQGQFLAAIEQAQVLIKQYPETFIFWNILGASAAKIGKSDQAVNAFKKVIALLNFFEGSDLFIHAMKNFDLWDPQNPNGSLFP